MSSMPNVDTVVIGWLGLVVTATSTSDPPLAVESWNNDSSPLPAISSSSNVVDFSQMKESVDGRPYISSL